MYKNPKELFEAQMNDIFDKKTEGEENSILQVLTILLGMPPTNRDLLDLYELLGLDGFSGVVSLFENRTVTFPSKSELNETVLTALIFYYREIENLSWAEIKEKIPFDFSPISYSTKIKKLNHYVVTQLLDILGGTK